LRVFKGGELKATKIFIVFCIAVFILQQLYPNSAFYFGLNLYFFKNLYLWQPLSSMFMHGNLMHLAMNMAVLYQFGSLLERNLGTKNFTKLFIIGGFLTGILSVLFLYIFNLNHLLVGASGAISVLIGLVARHDVFNRKGLIVAILLISFAPLMLGVNIAWYAHLFGFIIGWFWKIK
jgi:membrane associated rhomboid family serine protease